jgi:GMP synthase (glutamine-hydrolysing)
MNDNKVAIIDFGSQTTQLIARRVRELGVYCKIFPCTVSSESIKDFVPAAIILSGGPASVSQKFSPKMPIGLIDFNKPILGICYGMQLFVSVHDGKVNATEHQEFGRVEIKVCSSSLLFKDLPTDLTVWMSHGDQVINLPASFVTIAKSANCPHAAIVHSAKQFFGVQFHPEVVHTAYGKKILSNFLFEIVGLVASWEMGSFLQEQKNRIQKQVGKNQVLMALSGGVDSSVSATLIHKAIGDQLICVYVDTGLGRLDEVKDVENLFKDQFHINLHVVDAKSQFYDALSGVTDPEQKRKIVGKLFIDIFTLEAKKRNQIKFLGQGTLYPDVVESVSAHGGPSSVIKSHHNVGGLPEDMHFQLIEPLRELFKDEVRILGLMLGLPKKLIERQPFPGPGLAIRVLGEVTFDRCRVLQKADFIVREEIELAILQKEITQALWQWFAVLLPVHSVGVMGDGRTYGETIAVRCVESIDGMTADWVDLPKSILGRISNRIINEVRGISRVVYDISSKPPSTIEWE